MKIAIVGGGITGLSLGYYFAQKYHKVTIFEKEDHLGGLASVFEFEGTKAERFYHHFFSTDEHLIGLIDELGLSDRLVWARSSMGFYTGGRIFPFTSPLDLLLFPAISFPSRIRLGLLALKSKMIRDSTPLSKINAKKWLIEQIGEEAYLVVWEPLLVSKFGKECENVPASWVWGRLAARAGSRGIASERLGYLKGGLGSLFDALADKIGDIRHSSPIKKLSQLNGFDRIIFTMAPPLVSGIIELDKVVKYAGNVCVVIKTSEPVSKYYWTNIGGPSFSFCAVVEQNNAFDDERYHGKRLIYLSRYALRDDRLWAMNDQEIIDLFIKDLRIIKPGFKYECAQVFRDHYAQPLITLNYVPAPFTIEKGKIFMVNNAQIYPHDRGLNDSIQMVKCFLSAGWI